MRRQNVPDFSANCRSGDGEGDGVGGSTVCGWTLGVLAAPALKTVGLQDRC
jgi:hypothetical protein